MGILGKLEKLPVFAIAALSLASQTLAQEADKSKSDVAAKSQAAAKQGAERAAKEVAARSHAGPTNSCPSRMPREYFFVDFSGSVSNTGRTYEGPLCIVVFHNPIQQFIGLQTSTTTASGPDLSKVVLGGAAAGGAPPTKQAEKKPANLHQAISQLYDTVSKLNSDLSDRRKDYREAVQAEDQAIGSIARLRQTTALLGIDDATIRVKSGYEALRDDLHTALLKATFVPSDHADKTGDVLLADAESHVARLNTLPLDFVQGAPASFDCESDINVAWSAWLAKCKDGLYTPLKTMIDANLQAAQDLASNSDNVKALIKKIAIVQYWDTLFSTLGLRTNLLNSDIEALDIDPFFYTQTAVRCGVLFNQTSNTAVNIVTADLTPTLQGNDPNIKAQNPFVTVSCGTPFAVSAGVGFHNIEQKQFAIVQSPDGKGGVINTFGTTSDSKVTPVALALIHVRLSEWDRHKFAFYGSLGVGGSLQNQSNSSPVQFLPGVSVSFWRTMYLTFGPEIGNQTSLTGGFKLGDTVPSGVTSINSVTQTSHAVGFGLAISFTKP